MRLFALTLLISILFVGCDEITEPDKNTIKLEQADLDKSPGELVDTLKLIETWTLDVLDTYEQFSIISEKQKEEIINELSEVYTSDAANDIFFYQYRLLNGDYQRVPTDFVSIQHIRDDVNVQKTFLADHILLEVTGKIEEGAVITAHYYLESTTYKLISVEFESPY